MGNWSAQRFDTREQAEAVAERYAKESLDRGERGRWLP
jgi:hypothetical protein